MYVRCLRRVDSAHVITIIAQCWRRSLQRIFFQALGNIKNGSDISRVSIDIGILCRGIVLPPAFNLEPYHLSWCPSHGREFYRLSWSPVTYISFSTNTYHGAMFPIMELNPLSWSPDTYHAEMFPIMEPYHHSWGPTTYHTALSHIMEPCHLSRSNLTYHGALTPISVCAGVSLAGAIEFIRTSNQAWNLMAGWWWRQEHGR